MHNTTAVIFIIAIVLFNCSRLQAETIGGIEGIIGVKNNKAEFTVREGEHKGVYRIVDDIKGVSRYPGARVVALDAELTDSTIRFERFQWAGIRDFMLAPADLLPGWQIPKTAVVRAIPPTFKIPSLVQPPPKPLQGYAQRLLVLRQGAVLHAFQIRYFEFNTPSDAAMFAERWSSYRGVKRTPKEDFRRSYERYAAWVVNADDERKQPDYWSARFILEALSRKFIITLDTSVIFNAHNQFPVLFSAGRDTVSPGDTITFIGNGFSPFVQDNIILIHEDTTTYRLPALSSTEREITTMIPYTLLRMKQALDTLKIAVQLRNYYRTNTISFYVRRK